MWVLTAQQTPWLLASSSVERDRSERYDIPTYPYSLLTRRSSSIVAIRPLTVVGSTFFLAGYNKGLSSANGSVPVPAHWNVRRLRTVVDTRVSNVDKHSRMNEKKVYLCNYVEVYKNDRITPGLPFMQATASVGQIDRFSLRSGDVLITKDSEIWNDIGVPSLVDNEDSNSTIVSGYHLALLRPLASLVHSGYLFRALQSTAVASQLHIRSNGVTRFGLTRRAIKEINIPLPPLDEQEAIAGSLDVQLVALRRKRNGAVRQIKMLNEYRERLIADVVTGKLDVRESVK